MAQCRHSVNLDDITFGDDGSRGSPVFYLTYFQMHLDFVDLTCSTELQRHQLVRLNERQTLLSAPAIDICSAPLNLLPGLQDEFDKSIRSASFFLLKMNIDLGYTYSGVCKNIAIYESLRYRTIECTTSIHSFGKKILETTEMRYPLNQDDRLIYRFDFAGDFFNTFLNGFSQLETYSEAVWAIENLTVMQIYKDIDAGNAPTTVLCLAFVFEPGAGGIDVLRLKDYGYTD
ncbi:uncharacterized protein BJ171DRAFT_256283 [Polychytrium aggregatum]|uniref:uncharacterized protein n=1 Tax=Polychytrium aggregatum TaxID=110093 RepID=UPI0022FE9730|nr:uncharacterized protein BJ171DRAFT_256283 [Polychytrium aggregatum]KAI9207847.1 hypothetical protein BJ171DRAFT_256283 [Polychytrium aggregatum]